GHRLLATAHAVVLSRSAERPSVQASMVWAPAQPSTGHRLLATAHAVVLSRSAERPSVQASMVWAPAQP
ncbi:hypothetical protein CTI14_72240, partial [Methylobacterium radiotolerans]